MNETMEHRNTRYAIYERFREHGGTFRAWRYKGNKKLEFQESQWVPQALRVYSEIIVSYKATYGVLETRIRPLKSAAK